MGSFLKQSTSVDVGVGPFLDETDGKTAETLLTITQPDIRLKKNGGAWAQKAAAQTLTHEEAGWYELTLDGTDTDTLGILIVAIHESGALPVWKEYMIVAANVYDSLIGGGDVLDVSTTQFNGSAVTQASGRPEVNMTHIAGSAVSTSTAQLGVNIVNFGGSAGTFASGRPEVNTSHIAGSAVSTSTAQLGVNVVNAGGTAWASGSITSGVFAAGAIDAAAIAPDAIGASEFAQAAADKVWSTTTRILTAATNITSTGGTTVPQTGDSFGRLGAPAGASVSVDIAAIQTDVDNIQTRLPTVLVGGRMDSYVGAMATGVITSDAIATDAIGAAELAADAVTEIGTAARNSRVQGTTGRQ